MSKTNPNPAAVIINKMRTGYFGFGSQHRWSDVALLKVPGLRNMPHLTFEPAFFNVGSLMGVGHANASLIYHRAVSGKYSLLFQPGLMRHCFFVPGLMLCVCLFCLIYCSTDHDVFSSHASFVQRARLLCAPAHRLAGAKSPPRVLH